MFGILTVAFLCPHLDDWKSRGFPAAQHMKERSIPLKSVYATFSQEECTEIKGAHVKAVANEFDELQRSEQGASNVMLVRASNLADAVGATHLCYKEHFGTERPWPHHWSDKTNQIWAAVHFGCATSSGPYWIIHSVTVAGNRIRVSYSIDTVSTFVTNDLFQYYAWIPLGVLPTGKYSVELFNKADREVVLLRRVAIDPDKPRKYR